jgi:hypothetical protein
LSVGTLLLGNQDIAPTGSLTTYAPSSVVTQPSCESSGSVYGAIIPPYAMRVVNVAPPAMAAAGVMISLSPSRVKVAAAPSTSTFDTERPWKSSENCVSGWVAFASMTVSPSRTCPTGWYWIVRS